MTHDEIIYALETGLPLTGEWINMTAEVQTCHWWTPVAPVKKAIGDGTNMIWFYENGGACVFDRDDQETMFDELPATMEAFTWLIKEIE